MPTVDEIAAAGTSLNAALRAGITAISGDQQITFVKYDRRILPLDGFVYWIKASLLGDPAPPVTIGGSLHLAIDNTQSEAEAFSRVAVVFTSKEDALQGFIPQGVTSLLVGSVAGPDGGVIRFAFSRLGFFQNAGIFHYSGIALYPTMTTVVDDLTQFDVNNLIVSNSLPAWLSLNNYAPFYGFGNTIPLFPSFLAPSNIVPPYGTVHVLPDSTEALASVPFLSLNNSHFQLAHERVRVTLYGVNSAAALTFLDCVLQFSQDYDVIGLMNTPVVRDDKVPQAEFGIIAAKKIIDFEVSYTQTGIRNLARQYIIQALSTVRPIEPIFPPVFYLPLDTLIPIGVI